VVSTTTPQDKAKVGRPSDYNDELAGEILLRVAQGESLRSIGLDPEMPESRSIWRWLVKYPEFSQQYALAKEDSADVHADEILDIADNGTNDWMATNDENNAGYRFNGEAVARSRLRVDARKWVASKLKPKKYGEKVESTVNLKAEVAVTERPTLSKEEWLIKHGLSSN